MPLCIVWDKIFRYNSSESQKSSAQENILLLSEKLRIFKSNFFCSKIHWNFFFAATVLVIIFGKNTSNHANLSKTRNVWYILFFWLFMTKSSLYILSDSYTSKNMLGTKNVRYGGIFKASKKTCQITHIVETARAKTLSPILW